VTHTRAWRSFKRMQDVAAAIGSLIYAAAAGAAWFVLPAPQALKLQLILFYPATFLLLTGLGPLLTAPPRRWLLRRVWSSFSAGVGQSAGSVGIGLGLLAAAAAFIGWRLAAAAHGAGLPTGLFCGYAAGIGVLWAQAATVRLIEREPGARPIIEEAGPG